MNEKVERILVTTDGSAESEYAFAAMMPIVRVDAPDVAVLQVVEDDGGSLTPSDRVAKACSTLKSSGVKVHLEIRNGEAAREIVALARSADLLVMSTHGRGGWKRLTLGSVTESVLREVDVPMLITRPGITVRHWGRLIVALDGSPRAERILEDVIPLARRLHAPVDLIRTMMPPITSSGLGDIGGVEIRENPIPYLEGMREWLGIQGVDASVAALEGRAGAEILRYAERQESSLLCMTTHGRSGLPKVILGSIADEVIRHAPCPVLVRRSVSFSPADTAAMPGRVANAGL